MENSKLLAGVALALLAAPAFAGLSDVVSLGKGRYMIGGTSATVFGNASKMQAKAMTIANQHCGKVAPGSEAVVQEIDGEDGKAGGLFASRKRASAQLIFTCEAPGQE